MKLFVLRFGLLAIALLLPLRPPAGAAIVVLSALAHEHVLSAGEAFDGAIVLRNSGPGPATARISQTDYRFAADGSNDFGRPGLAPRSNAGWLEPATTRVTLPPGEVVTLRYRGRIPADAALRGSYWSMVIIEDTAIVPGANGISTIARYGIQVVTHIGQTGARSVRFTQRELQRQDTGAALVLDVENDGQRLIFPKLWVELYDGHGAKLGRFGGESVRLYPECSARFRITLPSLPRGKYQALILADCGGDQLVGTQGELAF